MGAKSTVLARKTLKAAVFGIAAAFILAVTPVAAAPCAAGKVAERAGTAFVKAASSRSAAAFSRALQRHADMRSIALFALGKHRKKLPKSDEAQYVSLTSRYVSRTLASFSKKFRANSVEAVRCRGKTVESRLNQLGGRQPQKVLFRIKGSKVSDVNVQNVWLAQLLRSNFSSVLKRGGGKIGVLLAHLGGGSTNKGKINK